MCLGVGVPVCFGGGLKDTQVNEWMNVYVNAF